MCVNVDGGERKTAILDTNLFIQDMSEDQIIGIQGLQWNPFAYREIQNGVYLRMEQMVRKLN